MAFPLVLLILGLIGLWLASGIIIEAAQNIARFLKISELFIGLTIISIGTSLAEIATHIAASIDNLKGIEASGIAVGTNIGSNIVQITLILGLVGILTRVFANKTIMKRDYWVMLGSIVLLFVLSLDNYLSPSEGIVLALLYIIYMIYLSQHEKIYRKVKDHRVMKANLFLDAIFLIMGIALIALSAKIAVDNAIILSFKWGVAESFIGALIIGFSTALPEFTTAVRGIMKGAHAISLGTLIGSNITNPLFAMGIGAAISGYAVDKVLVWFDIPFWFIVSIVGLLFFRRDWRLDKKEAAVLIIFYVVYVLVRVNYLA